LIRKNIFEVFLFILICFCFFILESLIIAYKIDKIQFVLTLLINILLFTDTVVSHFMRVREYFTERKKEN